MHKHIRLPFFTSNSITYFPFQILHCDLWKLPLESFSRHKYYLVLLDDFTHYTWKFPLRSKSDVFSTIRHLYSLILNQFHMFIQCIQCDNGREFDNNNLRNFFASNGIVFCYLVHTHFHKMGKPNVPYAPSTISFTPLFYKPLCRLDIGRKH